MLSRLMRYPIRLILVAIIGLFALYELSVRIFAYTGDAYVTSDIVILSSEIEGPISKLAVQNNAAVKAGDLLFEIDATPYRLQAQEAEAALAQAKAGLDLANDEVAAAQANLTSAQAVQTNSDATLGRIKTLSKDGYSTDATLDVAMKDVATSGANVLVAQADLAVASRRITVSRANISAAEAALAKARYSLSKTSVAAPEAGSVAPFTARQGDYLQVGTQVMAVVTKQRRRVVANVAERHLSRIQPGQRVWLTLASDPWIVHAGKVTGIAPGIARSPDVQPIIPYVAPTTDWVRIPMRFPIEVTLDQWPDGLPYHLGADARVLIWF